MSSSLAALTQKSDVDQYFADQAAFLLQKQKLERIDNFNGYFDYLNNEFPCVIYYAGLFFKSVSHAYQGARAEEPHIRQKISLADSAIELYEIASKVSDPPDWMKVRVKVMEKLVRDKFRRHRELREKLISTANRELFNTFADASVSNLFWGIVDGKGQNQLGRLLELVRSDCQSGIELDKWLYMCFDLQEEKAFIPKIKLDVNRNDGVVEKIILEGKSFYHMGKLKTADVLMAHQSISRQHAIIMVEQNFGVCLMDLGSKSGSFIDGKRLEPNVPYRLKNGQFIQFAVSTRKYVVDLDYAEVEVKVEQQKKKLEKEMLLVQKLEDPLVDLDIIKGSLGLVVEDTLFVSGLPEVFPEPELKKFFAEYGEIKSIRVPIDKATGKSRKIAFITFKDEKNAKLALKANGEKFLSTSKLNVKLAESRNSDDILKEKLERLDKSQIKKNLEKMEKTAKRDFEQRFERREGDRNDTKRREKKKSRSRERRSPRRDRDARSPKKTKNRSPEKERPNASKDIKRREKSRSRSRSKEKEEKRKRKEKEEPVQKRELGSSASPEGEKRKSEEKKRKHKHKGKKRDRSVSKSCSEKGKRESPSKKQNKKEKD